MGREKFDTGDITFEAAEPIARGLHVKLNSNGTISIAGLAEEGIGFANEQAYAAGQSIGVDTYTKPGTCFCIAAAAYNPGQVLYGQAAGKVSTSTAGGALRVGIAYNAAGADGDFRQLIPDKGA